MNGEERRKNLLNILTNSDKPVAGVSLAKEFSVSRQVIVQDIALIRANGINIISTNRGYLIQNKNDSVTRVFKVHHEENEVEEELNMIIDLGGIVKDVFVYHKVYGVIKANMNIKSRRDVKRYMEDITSGKSTLLMNVTSGFHYHTIVADDEQTLDIIQEELQKRGFWAKLQDYEPVNFWGDSSMSN